MLIRELKYIACDCGDKDSDQRSPRHDSESLGVSTPEDAAKKEQSRPVIILEHHLTDAPGDRLREQR